LQQGGQAIQWVLLFPLDEKTITRHALARTASVCPISGDTLNLVRC
jgi:hypothetical protein